MIRNPWRLERMKDSIAVAPVAQKGQCQRGAERVMMEQDRVLELCKGPTVPSGLVWAGGGAVSQGSPGTLSIVFWPLPGPKWSQCFSPKGESEGTTFGSMCLVLGGQ